MLLVAHDHEDVAGAGQPQPGQHRHQVVVGVDGQRATDHAQPRADGPQRGRQHAEAALPASASEVVSIRASRSSTPSGASWGGVDIDMARTLVVLRHAL